MEFKGRSLLSMNDLTAAEIMDLLEMAVKLKEKKKKGIYDKLLLNKNVALIFEKSSTRTRCSFIVAANDEGAHAEYLNRNDIQLGRKESVRDTAGVLGRMFDLIGFRGFSQDTVTQLKQYSGIPVINGLTDEEHPTQALADLMTIYEHYGHLKGVKLCYVGDGRNNVANSLMIASAKTGLDFTIGAPASLMPDKALVDRCRQFTEESGGRISLITEPHEAVCGADAVYTDVWVSMGEEEQASERLKLLKPYQVNSKLFGAAAPHAIFLHDLPAVKGNEVTEDVFESKSSLVFEQAENRMHTIKAAMVAFMA